MIEQQKVLRAGGGYNEVIIDSESWMANMPRTVMAFYVPKGVTEGQLEFSRGAHGDFLRQYGITADQTPLVQYDQAAGMNPFALLTT